MAQRKTTKRKTTATKRRRTTTRRKKNSNSMVNFFVPMFFIGCILFCLGFLLFMGYRTATASSFFDMESVELQGVKNVPTDEIKKIVKTHTIQSGVWNADLEVIKSEIEQFKYVKKVSVSRLLPDTVQVIVKERKQIATVRIDGKDFWVDEEALVLNRVSMKDERPPFTMFGWDENDTEKAKEDNVKRVELYQQLVKDWKKHNLSKQVKAVNLHDMREPKALVNKDSRVVEIRIEGEDYLKSLQKGIETVSSLNKCIEYVATDGVKIRYDSCDS